MKAHFISQTELLQPEVNIAKSNGTYSLAIVRKILVLLNLANWALYKVLLLFGMHLPAYTLSA